MLGLAKQLINKPCYHSFAELFFYGNAMKALEDGIFNIFKIK